MHLSIKSPYIPLLAFLILLLLNSPISFDAIESPGPGWHFTIYPRWYIWMLAVLVSLLFAIIGYWLHKRKTDKINWTLFALHFLLTITTIIFIKSPTVLLNANDADKTKMMEAVYSRMELAPVARIIFIAAQLLFLVYISRVLTHKPKVNS